MILKVTCPCGCGHTFDVEVPKGTKNFSDEELAKRSERMKAIAGRQKGSKDTKPRKTRSDKGKPRLSRQSREFLEEHGGVVDVKMADNGKVGEFIAMVRNFESDPKKCPLAQCNGGPCDGVLVGEDGTLAECDSMMECYFKSQRYKIYQK